MQRMLVAALLAAAVTAGSPVASADHDVRPYKGGCGFSAVDTQPGAGADTEWQGEVDIIARTATTDGVPTVEPISVECELFVDFVSRGVVASASGTGVVTHVEPLRYTAHPSDLVTMCSHVEVGGHAYVDCGYEPDPPLTYPLTPIVDMLIDFLNEEVYPPVEAVACEVFQAYAGQYGPVLIDEGGDVYLFGDTYNDLYWDCPPYEYP